MADTKMSELLHRRELTGKWFVTVAMLGGLAVGGVYLWGLVVPWLLDVALNSALLAIVCVGFAAGCWGLWKMRTLLTYAYMSFVRWCTARFVDIDPIGVLNSYVDRYEDRKKEIDEAKGRLSGQVKQMKSVIEQFAREREQQMSRAEVAHRKVSEGGEQVDDFRAALQNASRQAKRLAGGVARMTSVLKQIEELLAKIRKLSLGVDASIEDIKANVDVVTREHRAITEGFRAFQAAQRAIGEGPEKALYNMTLDRLTTDFNEKMGQIDEFMEEAKKLTLGVEMDNMMAEEDAVAEIQARAKGKVRVSSDGSSEPAPPVGARVDADDEGAAAQAEEAAPDSFAHLYKKH